MMCPGCGECWGAEGWGKEAQKDPTCPRCLREDRDRLRFAINKVYSTTNGWVLATLEGALLKAPGVDPGCKPVVNPPMITLPAEAWWSAIWALQHYSEMGWMEDSDERGDRARAAIEELIGFGEPPPGSDKNPVLMDPAERVDHILKRLAKEIAIARTREVRGTRGSMSNWMHEDAVNAMKKLKGVFKASLTLS